MRKGFIKRFFSVLLSAALVTLLFAACGKTEAPPEPVPTVPETTTEAANPNVNPLTGLSVRAEALGKRPVAVMVENSPAARPQWGLSSPDVVIEGLAEGGITRMLWLYADAADMPKVGPTRSARHDYV